MHRRTKTGAEFTNSSPTENLSTLLLEMIALSAVLSFARILSCNGFFCSLTPQQQQSSLVNVTLKGFNVDFLVLLKLGFRSCLPLMANRSNTLKFRMAGTKQVAASRGVRFDRYGNSTGVSPCLFNGVGPVLPICGFESVSPLPIPINFLP